MEKINELLQGADTLMDQAEAQLTLDYEKGRRLFLEAICNLEQAFLIAAGESPWVQGTLNTNVSKLFEQCLALQPEFESIRGAVEILLDIDSGLDDDLETVSDTANEIWDFMYCLMEEME